MAPPVGLIGAMSTTDPTQIAELFLVYVSGPDEAASEFYWESFSALVRAVDLSITSQEAAAMEQSLGRVDGRPPIPDDTTTPPTGIAVT